MNKNLCSTTKEFEVNESIETCLKNFFFLVQALKAFSDGLKGQTDFSASEGEKEVNRKKNRYKDILPCKFYIINIQR